MLNSNYVKIPKFLCHSVYVCVILCIKNSSYSLLVSGCIGDIITFTSCGGGEISPGYVVGNGSGGGGYGGGGDGDGDPRCIVEKGERGDIVILASSASASVSVSSNGGGVAFCVRGVFQRWRRCSPLTPVLVSFAFILCRHHMG